MAILKIARMGHPVLSRVAEPVNDPMDPVIHQLVSDMIETMNDASGAGLAAPQVHVPLRVVVFYAPVFYAPVFSEPVFSEPVDQTAGDQIADDEGEGDANGEEGEEELTILINPVIEPLGEEMALGVEGCLSLPQMAGQVPRFKKIRYSGLSLTGERIERTAEGFHARVVQHECDHLDGILYPMRMDDLVTFGYVEELRKTDIEDSDYLDE